MERVFEDRKASRSLAVPTSDPAVRQRLRDLGEPQTCFAEANVDRRERLREALLRERQRRVEMGEGEDDVRSEESGDEGEEQDEEFYTEGTEALLEARRDIAWYSLARAKQRIARQRWEAKLSLEELVRQRQRTYEPFKVSRRVSVKQWTSTDSFSLTLPPPALHLPRLATRLRPAHLPSPLLTR